MLQVLLVVIAAAGLYFQSKNSNAAQQAKNANLSSGGTPTNTQSGTAPVVQVLANLNATAPVKLSWGPVLKGVPSTKLQGSSLVNGVPPGTVSTKNASGVYQPNNSLNNPTIGSYSNAGAVPTNPPFNAVSPKPVFVAPIIINGRRTVAISKAAVAGSFASPSQTFGSTTETIGAPGNQVEIAGSPLSMQTRARFGVKSGIGLGAF